MQKLFKVSNKSEAVSGGATVTTVQLTEEEGAAILQLWNLTAADAAEFAVGKSYSLTLVKPAPGK